MEDALGYAGRSVVVTGAASGMGAAAAQVLVELGAEVTSLDIKPTEVATARHLEVDLRDPDAIEAVAAQIDGPLDALFSCAGLPGPPFAELDVMLVNFVGARHLAQLLVPKLAEGSSITAISSSPRNTTSRVWLRMAGTSDATKNSPSPRPTTTTGCPAS